MSTGQISIFDRVIQGRQRRTRVWLGILAALVVILVTGMAITLMLGQSFTPPQDVLRVLMGENVPGASFTVEHLRLPRAVLSVLVGMSFGRGWCGVPGYVGVTRWPARILLVSVPVPVPLLCLP